MTEILFILNPEKMYRIHKWAYVVVHDCINERTSTMRDDLKAFSSKTVRGSRYVRLTVICSIS